MKTIRGKLGWKQYKKVNFQIPFCFRQGLADIRLYYKLVDLHYKLVDFQSELHERKLNANGFISQGITMET